MKFVVAIPNYNMRENIGQLLASITDEHADDVYVLDDASTDGSADYVEAEFPKVTVVRGDRNVGAGANRNRLLPFLSGEELVLYVDADLVLKSTGLAQAVYGWFSNDKLGMAGSLLLDIYGQPSTWNYGWAMNPMSDARTEVYSRLAECTSPGSDLDRFIGELAVEKRDTYNFQSRYTPPISRRVDWVCEGLFAVRADVFRQLGGYDDRFRYHTGQDLCLRLAATGYEVRFEPGIIACHLELDVRGERRSTDFREGQYLYYEKHWGMSRRVFDRLFPQDQ